MKHEFNRTRLTIVTLLAFVLLPSLVCSIERGTGEIGFDGTLAITNFKSPSSYPEDATELRIPSRIRYGTFTSEKAEVEIMLNLVSASQGNSDITALDFTFGLAIHPSDLTEGAIGFIEPFGGLRFLNANTNSDFQLIAGAEVGVKFLSTNKLAARLSVIVSHTFKNNTSLGSRTIGFNFGLSFFTKRSHSLDSDL